MTTSATISHDSKTAQTNQSITSGSNTSNRSQTCLKLKGSLVPMTVLELCHYNAEQIDSELAAKTQQAPGFFENLPVIIDLDKLDPEEQVPFTELISKCKQHSIKVVAIRAGSEQQQLTAKDAGLGILAKQKEKAPRTQEEPAKAAEPEKVIEQVEVVREVEVVKEVVKTVVQNERQQSKVVHHPIRSGQQVYAADGDLIILASVSAGAEILADGNIHVYGTLRGRALAGVKGNTNARIFCQSMQAELASVAGQYKISEDIDRSVVGKPTQVYLENDTLKFKVLEQ